MEVTLRDGSYVVDFQFTVADTLLIGSALDEVGFRWIEVGHGLGLGASRSGKGTAAASDEEYLEAASQAIKKARWGTFFIPGLGTEDDLRMAARHHMPFVRIGTNVTEVESAQRFIVLAKELGMIAFYNAMKSYAVPPGEFARCAARARSWGADGVSLVDSAGSMLPADVTAYLQATRAETDVPLGFHGHDNLSMAICNSVAALEAGAVLVDSSLQGLGRSAGNAVTELLVAVLKRRGLLPHLDLFTVMDIGRALVQPLVRKHGTDTIDLTAGYAGFHSSHLGKVNRYAERWHVDPRDLIVKLCERDQVNAPDALLDELGRALAEARVDRSMAIVLPARTQHAPGLPAVVADLHAQAVKADRLAVLNVAVAERESDTHTLSANVRSMPGYVMASVTVGSSAQLEQVLAVADGAVDLVLLDIDQRPFVRAAAVAGPLLQRSRLLTYSDSRVWVEAMEMQIVRLLQQATEGVRLVLAGVHGKSLLLAEYLQRRGMRCTLLADGQTWNEGLADSQVTVVWPADESRFGPEQVAVLPAGSWILDAGLASVSPAGLEEARRRRINVLRINIWPALCGTLFMTHQSALVFDSDAGQTEVDGVVVVSGGVLGERGTVVVDSVREPTRVLGIADGVGGLVPEYSPDEFERVSRVARRIVQQRLHAAPAGEDLKLQRPLR